MKIVFFVLLSIFAIVGISHIVFEICYRFFKIRDDDSFIVIIPKRNKEIDIEFKVRSAVAKMKKLFKNGSCDIFVLSDDLDCTAVKELSLLQKNYEYLKVVSKKEFIEKAGL